MSDNDSIDWRKTTFEGSRREQLKRTQSMSVRQRLEALDELTELSERLQTMPRKTSQASDNQQTSISMNDMDATQRGATVFSEEFKN